MALNQVVGIGSLFTQQWVDGLKHIPEMAVNCKIRIEHPTGDMVYDPVTNTYEQAKDILFDGKSRVQPRRSAINQPIPGNSTSTQKVQFQIPIDAHDFDLAVDTDQVVVYEAELNTSLTKLVYVVSEIVDSGNPFEFTFLCTVDQEARNGN